MYTITRGKNALSVFQVLTDGKLKKEQEILLHGENPRQMVLWQDKLFVVCMDTQNVLEMKLDSKGIPVQNGEITQHVERISYMTLI